MLEVVFLFILGLCIGSFINVLSDRLPQGLSIGGRSRCDYCKRTLSVLDLVPVFSYLFLGGVCRYCKKNIPVQYTLVELSTGICFVILSFFFPLDILFVFRLVLYSALIAIFITDLRFRIIPEEFVIVIMIITVIIRSLGGTLGWDAVLSGLSLFVIFLILYLLTGGRGMGMGDVKLALPMGFYLGYPKVIAGFYAAFLTGAFVSLILISGGKKKFGQTIAFGPFLVLATIVSDIWGVQLWVYFQRLLGF